MYSKDEAKKLKKEFWTVFGIYMKPHLSAEGEKINWINYKTGVKSIFFRIDTFPNLITVSIEITHKNNYERELYWNEFLQFKSQFHNVLENEWIWEFNKVDNFGNNYSSISNTIKGNIYNKTEWENIFPFLKNELTKLDKFWSEFKYAFI